MIEDVFRRRALYLLIAGVLLAACSENRQAG